MKIDVLRQNMNSTRKAFKQGPSFPLFSLFIFLFSLLISSCPSPHSPEKLPEGYGSFSLRVDTQRTIQPAKPDLLDFAIYELAFTATSDGEAKSPVELTNGNLTTAITLKAGTYNLTVKAYKNADKTGLAAQGTETGIVITAGQPTSRTVTLKALLTGGTGTFTWDITFPSFVETATMTITQLTPGGTAPDIPFSASNSITLNSGIYDVTFYLESDPVEPDYKSLEWSELVYIYSSLETSFLKAFTADYFNNLKHTVTFVFDNDAADGTQSVLHGTPVDDPGDPTKDDHTFDGWYTVQNPGLTDSPYDFTTLVHNSFTLYAKWIANIRYVATPLELSYVGKGSDNPDPYKNWTLTASYEQIQNIDISSITNWTPIGTASTNSFTGSYDGGGHTVRGLTIGSTDSNQGLFGYIGLNGKVENLGLVNVDIVGGSYIGGITGQNEGTIRNCYVAGSVEGSQYIGGITGQNAGTIQNCYVTGSVESTGTSSSNRVGGIAGQNQDGTILDCIALNEIVARRSSFSTAIGRVTGYSGIQQNNYAWSGMALWETLNGDSTTPSDATDTGKDGASITAVQAKTQDTWTDADFDFNVDGPWVWNSANSRPVLRNEVPQAWPEYLNDRGTEAEPFLVTNETELRYVGKGSANPSGYKGWIDSAHYRQTANIDLTGKSNWATIAIYGSYDGDGHTITGLTSTGLTSTGMNGINGGMFSTIFQNGMVENLGLINVNITGNTAAGGIAAQNRGTIQNCYVTGSVANTDGNAGGIAGFNSLGGTIQNCYVTGNVTSSDPNDRSYAGGIVGVNASGSIILNCIALNESVALGSNRSSIGRVLGTCEDSSDAIQILQSTYAWSDMALTNSFGATGYVSGINGQPITAVEAKTQDTWTDADFDFNVGDGPWVWNSANSRPVLRNEVPQPWPPYLVDPPADPGNGLTVATAFKVWNEATLRKVGKETGTGNWTRDAHYIQIANITLSSANWTPIGISNNSEFTGTYNGDGHTITGLRINATTGDQGMFGNISGTDAKVENLGLIDVNITSSSDNVGGIAGYNGGGSTIQNCYVTGSVTGRGIVGGIVGYTTGTIQNCYVTANVMGRDNIGGIAGEILGENIGTIQNCYVTGNVIGNVDASERIGGIVGDNTGTIKNCYVTGNVSGSVTSGITSTTINWVGGIVGINRQTIQNCYTTGNVTGKSSIGGIAGSNDGTVQNCYATGSVTASGTTSSTTVGGITGSNNIDKTIRNCIALNGRVSVTVPDAGVYRIGSSFSGTQNNYAWSGMIMDGSTSILDKTLDGSNGEDVTTANAMLQATWTSATRWNATGDAGVWNFTNNTGVWVWDNSGENMPSLRGVGTPQPWPEHLLVDGIFTNPADFSTWLAAQPANSSATPYTVKLNVSNLDGIATALSASGKNVNLDLSGSTFTSISSNAFVGCSGLTGITLPTSGVTSIGANAFDGCTSLADITIPATVTYIAASSFQNCIALTGITIPASVTQIGDNAFHPCPSLTSVTFATGSNISGLFGGQAFPEGPNGYGGNTLRTAYLAANPKSGTYTRAAGGDVWTKQP